jgi:hypothetical protein
MSSVYVRPSMFVRQCHSMQLLVWRGSKVANKLYIKDRVVSLQLIICTWTRKYKRGPASGSLTQG